MGPLVLAHRGARRDAPENTIEAFRLALAQGADGVELDVHRTADDGLVVHHDAEADKVGVLAERDLAAIQAARPDLPSLDDALDACAGALVNVEIKNLPGDADFDADERAAALVVECIRRRQGADKVLVSSFNLATIDRVRALDPELPTGFLVTRGIDPMKALALCESRGHGAVHPNVRMLRGRAAEAMTMRAHEMDVRVNVWTVNDAREVKRLATAGLDAIMTDVPEVALRALSRASA